MRESPAAPPEVLVLVPTAAEESLLAEGGPLPAGARAVRIGFGPVAAAASTARLLARAPVRGAVLAGIAGSYDLERAGAGAALAFGVVLLDGVGAGSGPRFLGPRALGFPLVDPEDGGGSPITDRIALAPEGAPALLTVCAASDGDAEARERRRRHPEALAEDMEGFACALAARQAGVPLRIVRGISNAAGDRDRRRWDVARALRALRPLLDEAIEALLRGADASPAPRPPA